MDENASFGLSMWDFCGGNTGNDEYRGNLVILFARLYLAGQEKVDIFGTCAKFIATIEKEHLIPRVSHDLSAIKLIMSTGSTMTHESFRYVYRDVKTDVFLSSASGGTDILGCFSTCNVCMPVFKGEL